uniref:Link domain-containing protein n=1 Tax=viral metagenome TaxID=1070528 RepID=A0A6C0ISJ7_9ZZZZ
MDNISYNEVNAGLGNVAQDTYNYMNNILSNPTIILILVIVLIIYVALFIGLGSGSTSSGGSSPSLLSTQSLSSNGSGLIASLTGSSTSSGTTKSTSSVSWIFILVAFMFVLLVGVNMIQYMYSVDIFAKLKNIFTNHPEVDIVIDQQPSAPVPEIKLYPEVFNIPSNTYGYEDAKAVCKAYGARLATYDEVENTYNKGGEWCNYGWSEGQMALFSTQKSTWDKLQTIEGHEHDCGRPGINGGYISNPRVKFGVNCYGHKPRMTSEEEELMATQPIYPKTMKDIAMEKRVEYWKDKLSEIIVSPFNHSSWSKI